jgi:hypothetical protein
MASPSSTAKPGRRTHRPFSRFTAFRPRRACSSRCSRGTHPDRVEALIVQNAVAHNEGLGAIWKTRRAFWADRPSHEAALRTNLLSLETTRARHVGSDPNPEKYDPDLWTDEYAFLNKRGEADIQSNLFYDYRTNVDAYPKWQAWMRETQPRLLVI